MPLGIFSSGNSNGPKPQLLTSEKEKRKKGACASIKLDIKDSKGTTIKLGKKSYTVEKKLAEGYFYKKFFIIIFKF